jgi:hypothetical protein
MAQPRKDMPGQVAAQHDERDVEAEQEEGDYR